MAGPNFVLDKGFLVDSAAANVQAFRFAKFATATTGNKVTTSAAPTPQATATPPLAAEFILGVYQDELVGMDAAKVATGKATINVRMIGITRCIAGAAVPIGSQVTSDSTGRAVVIPALTAGQSTWQAGIALTAAASAGDLIDVLLTPGLTRTNGGT
jgi:hypothetical protein